MSASDPLLTTPLGPVSKSEKRNPGGSSWAVRRRLMFTVVAFCMLCISWALWKNSDTQVMQAAVTMGFTTISAITGSYVFGAVWEDSKK